ncbi:MAG: S-methyl-5-thioribose-1-phosphate isomerase [Candidatus Omnitrophica bacterium]|nr:S-methyl-5-thioribose-1-phosphate isomerase [Candidatus Omnitrophota bacterium]
MNFETIRWENGKVIIIDQTKLPEKFIERTCQTVEELHDAIKVLAVRGAPLLGVTAAFGLYLGIQNCNQKKGEAFIGEIERVAAYIKTSRPTAVNLFWALERMVACARSNVQKTVPEIKEILFHEAELIKREDSELCRSIGKHGEPLIEEGDVVLTHCNAGALATAGIGTALAPLYIAHEKGKRFKVYADETRPLLQGSRLTAWELNRSGIDVTVICDNMAASLMRKGIIKKVIVGADRIAANGDAANKIGTYSVAVLAKYHTISFYIAAPYSTVDASCPSGEQIPIEERNGEELKKIGERKIAPDDITVYNPAFDVTPQTLITAFVTERGVLYPPFDQALKK